MTQEEKDLLLRDLCARLSYGVVVFDTGNRHQGKLYKISDIDAYYISESNGNGLNDMLIYIKPYLRPMSSMTEEEMKEYHSLIEEQKNIPYFTFCSCITRYLDSIHVDHRAIKDKDGKWKTMIQLGLALEAPEGMYNLNKE